MPIPLDVMEHKGASGRRGQRGNRRLEIHSVIIMPIAARAQLATLELGEVVACFHAGQPSAGGSLVLQHHIDGDPVQPRFDRALATKAGQSLPGANVDILRQLGGPRTVRRHAQTDREHAPRRRPVQRLERALVSTRGTARQRGQVCSIAVRGCRVNRIEPGGQSSAPGVVPGWDAGGRPGAYCSIWSRRTPPPQ